MVGSFSQSRDEAWEENIRIYRDESLDLALARASNDADADQVEYGTSDGQTLSWRVHSVRFVKELAALGGDGEEVFTRSLTSGEAQSLLTKIG